MKLLYGKSTAQSVLKETGELLERARREGIEVRTVAVSVGKKEEAECYLQSQERLFHRLGIVFQRINLPQESEEGKVIKLIERLNSDRCVTGILLALPLPGGFSARKVQSVISPHKDIEGVTPQSLGLLAHGNSTSGPATAEAVMRIIEAGVGDVKGKEAVVVGHSEIVGKPVALQLLEKLATVTVCHIGTQDLKSHTLRADLLVVAVGKPGIITGDMVKPGACVVDVGINRIFEGGKGKIVGDVDVNSVLQIARWVTPVPGGVGPVTSAVLARRAVLAALSQVGQCE